MELIEVVDRLSVGSAGELPQDTVEIVVKRTAAQWDGVPYRGTSRCSPRTRRGSI
jgi:hypothetical protein